MLLDWIEIFLWAMFVIVMIVGPLAVWTAIKANRETHGETDA